MHHVSVMGMKVDRAVRGGWMDGWSEGQSDADGASPLMVERTQWTQSMPSSISQQYFLPSPPNTVLTHKHTKADSIEPAETTDMLKNPSGPPPKPII